MKYTLSRPRSIIIWLSMTCLISASFALQIGSSEANLTLAKAPEPKTNFNSEGGPETTKHMTISYRSIAITKEDGKRSLSQLRSEIGEKEMAVVLKLNRIDANHLRTGVTLVIPEKIDELITYSPFPHEVETAREIPKLLLVSQRVQAFSAYEFGRLVRWGPTSTGKKETPTPAGLYHTNWKAKATRSTVNEEWLLPWYFNIDNKSGISFHQYEMPGTPASHGCIRLLIDDAAWIYGWADQWTLSADGRRVEGKGTPVLVFGEYDYGKQPPWKQLVTDINSAMVTGRELEETLQPHLPIIVE
jgi:lipoprotein-anchoring transpeptidase ErfK/SrfK